jgi:hypothetical protein
MIILIEEFKDQDTNSWQREKTFLEKIEKDLDEKYKN